MIDVVQVMTDLAKVRPLFHSERDFQHELAWVLKTTEIADEVRLERPLDAGGKRIWVDLLARHDGRWHGFELKYLTRRLEVEIEGEKYELRQQSAHDVRRYDFWRDVVRLQGLVRGGRIESGFAIALTNDPSYWKPGRDGTFDADFRVHEGRVAKGRLAWDPGAGKGTTRGRISPLDLSSEVHVRWSDYSGPAEEILRYIAVRLPVDPRGRRTGDRL